MKAALLIVGVAMFASLVMTSSAAESESSNDIISWIKSSDKSVLVNRAVAYAKGLYNSWTTGRGARNIFSSDSDEDDESLLLLLLGAAALTLPLILGGLLLAAVIPFIGTTLNPLNNLNNLGTGALTGLTGNIPTVTANTISTGRRRRSAGGLGFPSKLTQNVERMLQKLL